MKKIIAIAMAGIFALSLQGPVRAQKEMAPPPIPPLLESQKPLDHPEVKGSAQPPKQEDQKAKAKPSKRKKTAKTAKAKKPASKKRHVAAKKKNQKSSLKKRPAAIHRQAGPEES